MRVAERSARAVVVGTLVAAACGGASAGGRPVVALSSSIAADADFDAIRSAWRSRTGDPVALRARVERFVALYPKDGLVIVARMYLALLALDEQDFATADRELAYGSSLPPGTPRDLWTIASARRLRMQHHADEAMELLRPLVGKGVDPIARTEFQSELARAALATHRDFEAISYMDAWLRASSEEEKALTIAAVTAFVERIPKEVLVESLDAMRAQRQTLGYGADIERILAARLVQIATTSGDAQLARMLVESDAGAVTVAGDAGVELGELATSRRGINSVDGRTIGLLLPTESPALRDESADVLRGVMWALGLPRGVRTAAAGGASLRAADAGVAAKAGRCVPEESAPALEEPTPSEQVRLVTRDDAGSADRTEVSLDELAGEGAAVIVAGLDAQTATRAAHWAESHSVTVVTLVPPVEAPAASGYSFVLGERRSDVIDALARTVPALKTENVAPVVDESELAIYAHGGAGVRGLALLAPVSCDVPSVRAGDPRFPLAQWVRSKVQTWLVSGSPACSSDVVAELSASHAKGIVALTLEAAMKPPRIPGLRVMSASAGAIPNGSTGSTEDDELRRFESTLGAATWWTTLGRDATTLARVAVRQLQADLATEPHEVSARRERARTLLAASRAHLWSTEAAGFIDGRSMKRTVCTVEAPR